MKKILMFLMCAIAVVSGVANAQEWPNRSIKFISPFAPGGSNDIATRVIAEKLSPKLQQTIIVENKPGANIRIASEIIARAEPDGYNFVMVAAPHTTNPALYGQLPYDTLKDFTPVVQVVRAPLFLMVPANSPIKTVAELLAASAKQPTGLNISSPGNGTAPHLALELFNNLAKSNLNHIPYKGDAPAVTDLLGERVDAGIHPIISPLPHVKSGKIRVLAVFGSTRSSLLPDVPSLGELGYKNTEVYTWFGLVGPAKLPVKIVDRLNKDVNEILSQPEVRQRFADMGMETVGGTSDQFAKFIRDDIQKWKTLVAQRNIKPD
ncbi:putative extra-cytoplasmic solute receptor [beta proteobacterium CB]|nr:putative extra-cytoplasmic solute receptor [beta proteobacterium CB]